MNVMDFEDTLTSDIINDCTQSGDNFAACEWHFETLSYPYRVKMIDYLLDQGFEKLELFNLSLDELKIKFLWVCAWNVKER